MPIFPHIKVFQILKSLKDNFKVLWGTSLKSVTVQFYGQDTMLALTIHHCTPGTAGVEASTNVRGHTWVPVDSDCVSCAGKLVGEDQDWSRVGSGLSKSQFGCRRERGSQRQQWPTKILCPGPGLTRSSPDQAFLGLQDLCQQNSCCRSKQIYQEHSLLNSQLLLAHRMQWRLRWHSCITQAELALDWALKLKSYIMALTSGRLLTQYVAVPAAFTAFPL